MMRLLRMNAFVLDGGDSHSSEFSQHGMKYFGSTLSYFIVLLCFRSKMSSQKS